MRTGWRLGLATIGVVVVIGGLPASAASAAPSPTWGFPVGIAAVGGFTEPDVAIDPQGDAAAIWASGGLIQASFRPASGPWSAPVVLTLGFARESFRVQFDGRGDAVVVMPIETGSEEVVEAVTRPAGGEWSAPAALSSGCEAVGFTTRPHLAVDSNGAAVAGWRCATAGEIRVQTASRAAGGAWGSPENLDEAAQPDGQETLSPPSLALDPQGDATAAWVAQPGVVGPIDSDYRPAGGSWQAPVKTGNSGEEPSLAADGLGNAYLEFESPGLEGRGAASVAVRSAGVWQPSQVLTAGHWGVPQIAADDEGDVVVVWSSEGKLYASYRPSGAAWETPALLSTESASGPSPGVGLDSSGDALAVFASSGSGEPIRFVFKPAHGAWQTPGLIAGPGGSEPRVAVNEVGRAAAVWLQGKFPGPYEIAGAVTTLPVRTAEYKNWVLAGAITDRKQHQPITLPEGSTFNGHGELNVETGEGSVRGTLAVPPFKTTIKLFGALPLQIGMAISAPEPLAGGVARDGNPAGKQTLAILLKLEVGVTSLSLLGLTLPISCASSESATLDLSDTVTSEELLNTGWSFAGAMTLPSFKCQGPVGPLAAMVLTALLSGPENTYALSVKP